MEIAETQASELQASSEVPSVAVQYVASKLPPISAGVTQLRGVDTLCDNCSKTGQHPYHCYSRKLTCHLCGKRGHIVRACRAKFGSERFPDLED